MTALVVRNRVGLTYLDDRPQLADYKTSTMLSMIVRPSVTVAVFEGAR